MRGRREGFCAATRSFYGGGMSAKEYKGISGGFGSYSQRGGRAGMVRLRLAGGVLDRERLDFIVDCIDRHGIGRVHMTACQSLQLHDLDAEAVCAIVNEAPAHGIDTFGGGGDHPRNVMASPLSGVDPEGCFDVLPYAVATERYVLSLAGSIDLPRKLKIAFAASPANDVHATFRDLGFLARPDGRFDVHTAGGLGRDPRPGLHTAVAEPSEVLLHVRAMIDVFQEHGDRGNRARARTRFIPETLGEERYREAYARALAEAGRAGLPRIGPPAETYAPEAPVLVAPRIRTQRQAGLHSVSWHPIGGDIEPAMLKRLRDALRGMPGAELRLSTDQTLHIINCGRGDADTLAGLTADGAADVFEASVSCVGATVCQIGLRDSRALLERLVAMSRRNAFPDGTLPQVRISGCGSSCAAHQIGTIGFVGVSARTADGDPVPAYAVTVGGSRRAGRECFGRTVGSIPEDRVPAFMEAVGRAVTASGKGFADWYADDPDAFGAIASEYTVG